MSIPKISWRVESSPLEIVDFQPTEAVDPVGFGQKIAKVIVS